MKILMVNDEIREEDEILGDGVESIIVKMKDGRKITITDENGRLGIESNEKYLSVTPFSPNSICVD